MTAAPIGCAGSPTRLLPRGSPLQPGSAVTSTWSNAANMLASVPSGGLTQGAAIQVAPRRTCMDADTLDPCHFASLRHRSALRRPSRTPSSRYASSEPDPNGDSRRWGAQHRKTNHCQPDQSEAVGEGLKSRRSLISRPTLPHAPRRTASTQSTSVTAPHTPLPSQGPISSTTSPVRTFILRIRSATVGEGQRQRSHLASSASSASVRCASLDGYDFTVDELVGVDDPGKPCVGTAPTSEITARSSGFVDSRGGCIASTHDTCGPFSMSQTSKRKASARAMTGSGLVRSGIGTGSS